MRILITGASGQLGAYLLRELRSQGDSVVAWSGSCIGDRFGFPLHPVALTDRDGLAASFREAKPDVVIHAAAISTIAECFRSPVAARKVNVEGTAFLAELAAATGSRFVQVSTDLVFDGGRGWYREQDIPLPGTVYGRTKFEAEQVVMASRNNAVVRVSLLFGPTLVERPAFFDQQVQTLQERKPCTLFADEWRTPLGLVTAAQALLAIARSDWQGILHLGGPERLSRLEMGQRLAAVLGSDPSVIVPATRNSVPSPEPRPADTSLDSTRCRQLFPRLQWPEWSEAVQAMMTQRTPGS